MTSHNSNPPVFTEDKKFNGENFYAFRTLVLTAARACGVTCYLDGTIKKPTSTTTTTTQTTTATEWYSKTPSLDEWEVRDAWALGVRSTPFTALNPQENKNKEMKRNRLRSFLCGDQGGIPREQNRELTTTWASIYITLHEVRARLTCDAQPDYQSAKLKEHVRSTALQYITCHGMFQRVPWSCAIDKIKDKIRSQRSYSDYLEEYQRMRERLDSTSFDFINKLISSLIRLDN